MPDNSDYGIIDLTDKQAADIAAKHGVTVEKVWEEWELTKALGKDGTLAEMDQHVAEVEHEIQTVTDDVIVRYLGSGDRTRAMADFYGEGWGALTPEEVESANVGDLFLNLSVAIFKLAEAQEQIASLLDGNRRQGSE